VPAVAAAFIREAGKAGIEPTVIFAYDGIYATELSAAGVRVTTLGKRTPLLWRAKRFLLNWYLLTRGKQFDAVHIHSIKLAWSVLAAKYLGLKVVFHLHELPGRIGWLLHKAIAVADTVVFCSQTCATHFAEIPARRRETIINAMSFSSRLQVRHEGVGKRVVMVASINRNKGQELLLQAFARLENKSAELWLYGTTGLSAHRYVRDLKRYAEAHGFAERVFFPGPTADVFKVFAETSIVVHTSLTESFGMALVEAQSCGVPVVAHDLEGMQEVVADGITGFLVKPGDVAALTARMDELLFDPELRNRMGGAGYKVVRQRFDIVSRIQEYKRLYAKVCDSE
jgi:glycosyltransferase involved in cell wall biosynthesis